MKSSNSRRTKSRAWGRRGWRASWVVCQAVSPAKVFSRSRSRRSWSRASSSRLPGSSAAWSAAILASISSSGCSKSSASGMLHHRSSRAEQGLELAEQLGACVHGESARADDDFLGGQYQVQEDRDRSRVLSTGLAHGGQWPRRVVAGPNTDAQHIGLAARCAGAAGGVGQGPLQRAYVIGENHAAFIAVVEAATDQQRVA